MDLRLLFAVLLFGVGLLVYVFDEFGGFVIGVSLVGLVDCCVCFFISFWLVCWLDASDWLVGFRLGLLDSLV